MVAAERQNLKMLYDSVGSLVWSWVANVCCCVVCCGV